MLGRVRTVASVELATAVDCACSGSWWPRLSPLDQLALRPGSAPSRWGRRPAWQDLIQTLTWM
jgi:hypothetical protein